MVVVKNTVILEGLNCWGNARMLGILLKVRLDSLLSRSFRPKIAKKNVQTILNWNNFLHLPQTIKAGGNYFATISM